MIDPVYLDLIRTIVITVGVTMGVVTYRAGQQQRKLENSLKLLELFNNNLEKSDISNWKKVFQASSEPSGSKKGYFYSSDKQQIPLNSLFSEGPDDHGATIRITEQIDLVCYEILNGSIELRIIFSNLGQLMIVIDQWYKNDSFLKENYPHFNKVMKMKELRKLPYKTIQYCE
jgi:hypothetical protein